MLLFIYLFNHTWNTRPLYFAREYLEDIIQQGERGKRMGLGPNIDIEEVEHNEQDENKAYRSWSKIRSPLFAFTDYLKFANQQLGYCFWEGWEGTCEIDHASALHHFQAASDLMDPESAFAHATLLRDMQYPEEQVEEALERCETLDPYCRYAAYILYAKIFWLRLMEWLS